MKTSMLLAALVLFLLASSALGGRDLAGYSGSYGGGSSGGSDACDYGWKKHGSCYKENGRWRCDNYWYDQCKWYDIWKGYCCYGG
jgi:hypothetical protein